VIDVIDQDRLGAGAPPKLLLRVGDDKPPTLEFRLRGIGTQHHRARDPAGRAEGEGRLRPARGRMASFRDRRTSRRGPEGRQAPPPRRCRSRPAEALFVTPLSAKRAAPRDRRQVDLRQWNKVPDEKAPENPIRPGMLLSLRFHAKDNFGPGEPHEGLRRDDGVPRRHAREADRGAAPPPGRAAAGTGASARRGAAARCSS
jgi:hypothetical protein